MADKPHRQRTPAEDAERALSALFACDPGCDRETWVRLSMAAKAAGLTFEDWLSWCSGGGNFAGEADCASVWKSLKVGTGVGEATLFRAAMDAGWRDPTARRDRDPSATPPSKPRPSGAAGKPADAAPSPPAKKREPLDPAAVWAACVPATAAHGYVQRKRGSPEGLRVYPDTAPRLWIAGRDRAGSLAVPMTDPAGKLINVQLIAPAKGDDGTPDKVNLTGCAVAGTFTLPALPAEDQAPGFAGLVAVVEGIGAAWAVRAATGAAAVAAFGAGRMETAARQAAAEHPGCRLVLVADTGKAKPTQAAAKALRCAWCIPPDDLGGNSDVGDMLERDGPEAVADLLRNARAELPRWPLLTPDQFVALRPVRWIVRDVLPESGLTMIFGPPGAGKSFLLLDMLAHVATGHPWFGFRTRPTRVVYLALEGQTGLGQRVRAFRESIDDIPAAAFAFMPTHLDILQPEQRAELVEVIRAAGFAGGIVAIDTLARAMAGADENSSVDMGRVVDALGELQRELGGCVLAVHHSGKSIELGPRGHTVLHGALDVALLVQKPKAKDGADGEPRSWIVHKNKDGPDSFAKFFDLRPVALGTDSDGEPVYSCVVEPAEKPVYTRPRYPQGERQKAALQAIHALLTIAGKAGQTGLAGAPAHVPVVAFEAAVDKALGAMSDAGDATGKREGRKLYPADARAVVLKLIEQGFLIRSACEAYVWAPPDVRRGEPPDPPPSGANAQADAADDDIPF